MLIILRALFVLALGVVAITFIVGEDAESGSIRWFVGNADLLLISCLGVALVVIAVDIFIPQKSLKAISGVFFGIVAGMVFAFGLSLIVDLVVDSLTKTVPGLRTPVFADLPMPTTVIEKDASGKLIHRETTRLKRQQIGYKDHPLVSTIKLMIGVICCYLTVSFVLQTKDDIRFVVPYVEFSKESKGGRPLVLDTSAIIDGRIADLAATAIFESELVVPRFVLAELQAIADSGDKLKRNRGRRGLDVIKTLQANKSLDVNILNVKAEYGGPVAVDERLVDLAQKLDGRIVTADYNLNKVAHVRGVDVVNLNDLANALKPIFLPGESFMVKVIKAGEAAGQGIGYLEDGTMVVVEGGREHIGRSIGISVTSALQTSAGRMIFGKANAQAAPVPQKLTPTPPSDSS